jgi:hypothetical protein
MRTHDNAKACVGDCWLPVSPDSSKYAKNMLRRFGPLGLVRLAAAYAALSGDKPETVAKVAYLRRAAVRFLGQ